MNARARWTRAPVLGALRLCGAASGVNPLRHYLEFGYQEGRLPFAPSELIAANGFDYVYYLQHNPDVAASGVDPLQHFNTSGWHEGRNPNGWFDSAGYLSHYADVAAAGVSPLQHYNAFGWHEGRNPNAWFEHGRLSGAQRRRGRLGASTRSTTTISSAGRKGAIRQPDSIRRAIWRPTPTSRRRTSTRSITA